MNTLINITQIITLLTSLISIFIAIRRVDKAINKFWNDFHKYHLYTLKIAVLSEELPLIDRVHAGEEYLKLGGNGLIKLKYEELVKEALKEMKKSEN